MIATLAHYAGIIVCIAALCAVAFVVFTEFASPNERRR
jgi:hypothetical protein